MRCAIILTFVFCHSLSLHAEDADDVRERGIAALKDSQTNPRAVVDAARLFVKAAALYNAAGNEEKNVEMNSFLYWCKKKMTMEDINAFNKSGEAVAAGKPAGVETLTPKADQAQKFLDRAEQFAAKNPAEHLLIAIRFYEVADRFKGTDVGIKALDRSLKEQLQDKPVVAKAPVLAAAAGAAVNAPATAGSRPVPSGDDVKLAEHFIKDLFKADYAQTDAPGRLALVTKLLQQAEENKGDAASEYVLLREARDCAIAAGDGALAADVQKRLRDAFKFDFTAMLSDLRKLEAGVKTAEPASALATLYALGADDALAVKNYDQAVRYNARAETLLPLIKDTALKERLKAEIPRVIALRQAGIAASAAFKILAAKPDDPEANLTAGKFALQSGEFEQAFALLAKSKDATLANLAKRELAPSAEAAEQSALADNWFERASKETNVYLKARMQERAALWYGNVLPALGGLAKLKIETRLKGLPNFNASVARNDTSTAPIKKSVGVANTSAQAEHLPKLKIVKVTYGPSGTERDDTEYWLPRFEDNPYAFLYGTGLPGPDPAEGTRKTVVAELLVDGVSKTFKVVDYQVLVWPWLKDGVPFKCAEFKILSAQWGAYAFVDVTTKVQQMLSDPNASFIAANVNSVDPCPGTGKFLVLYYAFDNKLFMKSIPEQGTVKRSALIAPKIPAGRWISKNATYTQSSFYPELPASLPGLLNGVGGGWREEAGDDDMAFSTVEEDDPWVIVDLKEAYDLQTVQIVPRRSLLDRAAPMIMYKGDTADGPWTEIWRTEDRMPEYEASVKGRAQFIKIVRTGRNYFHLFSIKVFAK